MKQHPNVLFAGQISGVEGYVESIATGLLAGMQASALARDAEPIPLRERPRSARWWNYICHADAKNFQPPTLPLTCCNRSTTRLGAAFATRSSATPWSASGRWRS